MADDIAAKVSEEKTADLDALFEALISRIKTGSISMDLDRIRAAYNCAAKVHAEQKRRDGTPYVSHCIATAEIVVEQGMDEDSVVAALLHDVIEDTEMTYEDVKKQFGAAVDGIVEG
ncbi:MAG: bifunctional (p)ppGpp synthetase/guanosine-3',5'-bis(diphosphate) 3'-pyrophosphohydrolase, partial [Clostridia bacterium]|nr:bifunctional (p)ppGpp synthetase/guanosine-3',5'-bis(diphosphate) 3'-pyrophosphohydrolase [Clostridia bacterium]